MTTGASAESPAPRADGPVGPLALARKSASAVLGYTRKRVRHVRALPSRSVKWFRATPLGLRTLRNIQLLRHPLELRRRQPPAVDVTALSLAVSRSRGYRTLAPDDLPGGSDLVSQCRRIYETQIAQAATERVKDRYLTDLLTDDLLREHPEFVDFALQEEIVAAATAYLGTVPVLRRVGLLVSTPRQGRGDSMLLHRDPEDFEQLKLFVNIYDVDESHGPFTFLPAAASADVLRGIQARDPGIRKFRRYSDAEAFEFCDPSGPVAAAGPAGSGVLVDTCRCLHYGSRVQPGHFRLVYYVQFCRYHLPVRTSVNRFDRSRFRDETTRWQILTPDRR